MDGDYEELYKWIEEHNITRPKRNLNRDFSDAMPLVEILKHHYPKLVEVHNYSAKNSFSQKLNNWETLNNKVLKKLKIHLGKKRIEQLARAESGIIEKLLQEVKSRVENKSTDDENCQVIYVKAPPNGSKVLDSPNKKMVPLAVVDKMKADLEEKNEAIQILKSKVDHLENLMFTKEERIKNLTVQLETLVNQPTRPDSGSKFFNFFSNAPAEPIKNEST